MGPTAREAICYKPNLTAGRQALPLPKPSAGLVLTLDRRFIFHMNKSESMALPLTWGRAAVCEVKGKANITLHLISPSSIDENGFSPAESFSVYGESRITELRDFLTAALKKGLEIQAINDGV